MAKYSQKNNKKCNVKLKTNRMEDMIALKDDHEMLISLLYLTGTSAGARTVQS